ncbi:hypothetical protein Golomagni_00071 [Golovinomyces magnicellulatus]|nr:hypothetical protein Golomagni_00071 [Golovinomyces magnicellulatus]
MNPIYNTELDSPNDMLVDSDELLNDAENEDDGNVHDILPDETTLRGDDGATSYEKSIHLRWAH